jgi:co-chaperonin GroES (HSP10)
MSTIHAIQGNVRAVGNRVLVTDMHFGEMKTKSGLIVGSDDGKSHGVKPRWGKVYSKGPKNNDPYNVGDWILVEHGRWTRGISLDKEDGDKTELRMVEAESILAWQDEEPKDLAYWGEEIGDMKNSDNIRPDDFV